MPESIERTLADISFESFDVNVYRNVAKGLNALSAGGSLKSGGRWNVEGLFGALYTSLTKEASLAELDRMARRRKVTLLELLPRDLITIRVSLKKVLNLTDPAILKTLRIQTEELRKNEWDKTKSLATWIWKARFEGILVPSAATEGTNLVIYPDRLQSDSKLLEVDRSLVAPK